jgi:hypothetical protein
MKQTVQMERIQRNMAPGVMTREGFLGTDKRKLIDILISDDAEVKRLDLDHRRIASVMRSFRNAGMKGLGEFITVPPRFEVRVESVRGKLACPFGHPGLIPKTNITVRNLERKQEITFTDLHIHLIEAHGFYEGEGSLFRLKPRDLVEILEIIP